MTRRLVVWQDEPIRHHRDETDCGHCGSPMYVGDRYWAVGSERDDYGDGSAYCSRDCANRSAAMLEEVSA